MKLTVKDAAALFDVSEKTIYRWIKRKAIPFYRINDQYRFSRPELLEWVSSKQFTVAPDAHVEPEHEDFEEPLLLEALQAGGIFYRIEGDTRDEVLADSVAHLRLPEEVDRTFLLQSLIAREELAATVVADGIAVPHPRAPIVRYVPRPMITLCFLERPTDFRSLNGKPVHALFILVSPKVKAHLRLLARLAFALRDERFIAAIRQQGRREEIFAETSRIESSLVSHAGIPME